MLEDEIVELRIRAPHNAWCGISHYLERALGEHGHTSTAELHRAVNDAIHEAMNYTPNVRLVGISKGDD